MQETHSIPLKRYPEYETDAYYFSHTVDALKYINTHHEKGCNGTAQLPSPPPESYAATRVKAYIEAHHTQPVNCPRFNEAADLLNQIVHSHGTEGLYSFFRVLSSHSEGSSHIDKIRFKKIMSAIFVPHFEPTPVAEIAHGIAILGHIAITPISGITHAPVAAASALHYHNLRKKRLGRIENPPLSVVESMLPLLQSMHTIGQHSLTIINGIEPVKHRLLPRLPPIDINMLQTALDKTRDETHSYVE